MRYLVLLVGLPAVFLTAVAGGAMIFFNDAVAGIEPSLKEYLNLEVPVEAYHSLTTDAPHGNTGLLLILAAAYGFLGVLLSGFLRCGWQGALLLIFPVLLTTAMNPWTGAFTAPQLFAGFLSFLVFAQPIADPDAATDDDKDNDDD